MRRGDNLYRIAQAHGITSANLRAWNGLGHSSVIHPGQRLVVSSPGRGARVAEAGAARTYVVRRGDTLYDISRAHAVTVNDLCRWNSISARKVLYPGEHLTIYAR